MPTTNETSISSENICIDICICTFRRPHVAHTLRSIAGLPRKPGWKIRVIIADNDATASARELVERTAHENGLHFIYLHAPAFNISTARNACLDAATAPLIAFIDDDELVTPGWIDAIIDEITRSNADVVLGPVNAIYGAGCPGWIKKGDFHSTRPVFVHGQIITGYSCNAVFRRLSPAVQGLRFREELGRSGGEDTAYFSSVHKAGGIIAYAPEAIVTEEVPAERATFLWLVKRRFRAGQTHGFLLLENIGAGYGAQIQNSLKAAAKALFCFAMALPAIIQMDRMTYWLLRGVMHCGVVCRLWGIQELKLYERKA